MSLLAAPQHDLAPPPLIGRDDVLAASRKLFAHPGTRLVTVTGPAGVGKTRLAMELLDIHGEPAGRRCIAIDLGALRDPDELDAEVARATGATVVGEPIASVVARRLAERPGLLLLDNAEHLLGIGPRLAAWLAMAPELRIIVTSRQRLNLTIETELELEPLQIRRGRAEGPLSPAARLFALMAGCEDPARLPVETVIALERLVARLEGLPLALELVAARLPALDAGLIAALVDSTDAIARSLPGVSTALDIAVARSYDLLSAPARDLLRYLTVFTGGFTVELVERLVEHAPALQPAAPGVADLLDELSAHHLVQLQTGERYGPRVTLLAMVSEAIGRIRDARGETEAAREAHARAVVEFAHAREFAGLWPGREHEISELGAIFYNIRAAIEWLHALGDRDALVRLVGALSWFWYSQGHYAHGLRQFERVLSMDPPHQGRDWARFQVGHGVLLDLMGRFEPACVALQAGVDAYDAAGMIDGSTIARIALGFNAFHRGQFDEAQASLDRAIQLARRLPERDLGGALEAVALANLGANAHERGDTVTAEIALRRASEIHEAMRFQWGAARSLCDLGGVLRDAERPAEALTTFQRALDPASALGDHRLMAVALAGIATSLVHDAQPRLATGLFGAVAGLRPIAGKPSFLRVNEAAWQRARDAARAALGDEAFARAWEVGARAPLIDLVKLARRAVQLGPDPYPPAHQALTSRERSVLQLVLQDTATGMIAALLGITERTVGSHLSAIFRKYGVNSRLELLALASHHRGEHSGGT